MIKKIFAIFLPWTLKRRYLIRFFGYQLDPTAKIGLSWCYPSKLIMSSGSKIDNFTFAVNLDLIELKSNAKIGRGNWITGFSTIKNSKHFNHQVNRRAELVMDEESAITKNHHIDCTNSITIGKFSTIAGYNSQLLTHSINILESIQDSHPIIIGKYCFIGTNVVILGGAKLPDFSVLGAKSLLNKSFEENYFLYGGVPAKRISEIPQEAKYFNRSHGFVY